MTVGDCAMTGDVVPPFVGHRTGYNLGCRAHSVLAAEQDFKEQRADYGVPWTAGYLLPQVPL